MDRRIHSGLAGGAYGSLLESSSRFRFSDLNRLQPIEANRRDVVVNDDGRERQLPGKRSCIAGCISRCRRCSRLPRSWQLPVLPGVLCPGSVAPAAARG